MDEREPFVLRHLGRELRYALDDRGISVSGPAGDRRIELGSIRSVRLARIGTLEVCALTFDGSRESTIATDESASRPAFAALVRALYAALAPRGIAFVRGSWLLVGIVVTICVVMVALGIAFYLGVIDAPAFRTRGMMLALVSTIAGPLGAWRARPRSVANETELAAALPKG